MTDNVTNVTTATVEKVLRKYGLIGGNSNNRRRISKNNDGTYQVQVNFWMWIWAAFCTALILYFVLAPGIKNLYTFGTWWLLLAFALFGSFIIIRMILWFWSLVGGLSIFRLFSFMNFQSWLLVGVTLMAIYLAALYYKPDIDLQGKLDAVSTWLQDNSIVGGLLDALNGSQEGSPEVPESSSSSTGDRSEASSLSLSNEGTSSPGLEDANAKLSEAQRDAKTEGMNLLSNGTRVSIVKNKRCQQKPGMQLCNGGSASDPYPYDCDTDFPCFQGTVNGRKQLSNCAVTSCPTSGTTEQL